MKINIKNFGPISHFSFDLEKDFHLIVGENSVGKSYAITVIYLVIKAFLVASENMPYFYRELELYNSNSDDNNEMFKAVKNLKLYEEYDATLIVEKSTSKFFSFIAQYITDSFSNTFQSFDSLNNKFSDECLSIELLGKSFNAFLLIVDDEIVLDSFRLRKKCIIENLQENNKSKTSNDQITIRYMKSKENSFLEYFNNVKFSNITYIIDEFTNVIKNIHYLPASRSGLYQALSAFGQIIAELSKKRSHFTNKIELPGLSEPVSDYFLKLSEIKTKKNNLQTSSTNKIAKRIEKEILKGEVEFDSDRKQLMFTPNNTDLRLELSSTSSMVSELSPIVAYLRYVLNSIPKKQQTIFDKKPSETAKSLLFIEEPEAHLHPEIQIKLMELFAELVQEDIKLVITSHSNYIFNKANNAIIGKSLPHTTLEATAFHMTDKGSIGKKLEVDDLGIEDDNFLRASEDLFEEKIALLDSDEFDDNEDIND